jgi:PAS domain S-box-containing protein
MCLSSLFPVLSWLGPELCLIYNDASIPLLGAAKHPGALGAPGRDVWREIFPSIRFVHAGGASGKFVPVEEVQLFIERHRPREEIYLTLSHIPIFSAEHAVDGVFSVCVDTTEQVVNARRLLTLRDLAKRTQHQTVWSACRALSRILRANPIDLPFAAIYLFDGPNTRAELAAFHTADDAVPFPEFQALDRRESSTAWPLAQVYESRATIQVHELRQTVGPLRSGPWQDDVETALILPLCAPTEGAAGALIAGVNARRVLDSSYRAFLDLCARHIGEVIAEVSGREKREAAATLLTRASEQRERDTEAKLRAAVQLLGLGLYAWDPRTNEIEWDDRVRAMWGLPAGAAADYGVWRAGIHAEDLPRVDASLRRATDPNQGVYDVEYRVLGRDGIERWVATRGLTRFEKGQPVSFAGVAVDITDRKRVEHDLEGRVEARTRELVETNARLRAQIEQREAIKATLHRLQRLDAIGRTTSGVAHDFNNLLGVVLTNTLLLERWVREPREQKALTLIRAAAERGAKLTAQLLAIYRGQPVDRQAVDVNTAILGMHDLLAATLGSGIRLSVDLDPALSKTRVDPTQLELIILNLAINGRDAMASGGELGIATRDLAVSERPARSADPPPGDYVCLIVTDTGAGIPDDVLPHVFDPFFTTKGSGKGSGLGLSQVLKFAKECGGGVRIDTRLRESTTVTVFIPRVDVAAHVQNTRPTRGRRQDMPRLKPTEDTPRVLVVDDDAIVLQSTVTMLEFLGYSVAAAGSGARALDLVLADRRIGVVLADFAMPGMNGAELSVALRAIRPDLPIVLLTGNADIDRLRHFDEAHVLQKPYSESDLVAKISAALS